MKVVFPRLYAIIDAALASGGHGAGDAQAELALAKMLAESGVELIQYRNKAAPTRSLYSRAKELADELRPRGVRFIVNDRADVAAVARAGGVHVGQADLSAGEARTLCTAPTWVGISTHTLEQVSAAAETSADYLAIGPIFETRTKSNPDAVVGIEFIQKARRLTTKPLVAIGGISAQRAAEVYAAGADCVAVARDLICAADVRQRAKEFLGVARRAFLAG